MNSNSRQGSYKSNTINTQDSRMRRHEVTIELRKSKKEDQMFKRRNINDEDLTSPLKELSGQSPVQLSVDEIVAAMNSEDQERQFLGMQSARKMLSRERNLPIDLMIGHGIVPICIRFLQNTTTMLQFEAAWALTNIASGTSDQTRCVIEHNAVPHFVALLQSKSINLAEQAVWAQGNIAGDGATARDIVIHYNVIDGILPLINNESVPQQEPIAADIQVLADACGALSYVTDGDNNKIQAVVDSDAVPRLVKLLQMDEPSIIVPALRSVGNIVTGTDQQTDVVIAAGGLPRLGLLLQHNKSNIVKEAAWTAGIFQQLRHVLEKGDFKAQEEAAWAVTNTTTSGTPEQIVDLIEKFKILKPFIDLLDAKDPRTIKVVQTGLSNLFALAEKLGGTENLCLMSKRWAAWTSWRHKYFSNGDDAVGQELAPQEVNGALEFSTTQPKAPEGGYTF
ncbi:hypothetical protein KR074_011220 [Drosophila pseudoananassae]|nr:hypothetical protein KR074_011220 [Drosophila pseudoananassae]